MIIVDSALKQRAAAGNPVRVGLVGAGSMARAIALELLRPPVGMRLVAIGNRTISKAERAYRDGAARSPGKNNTPRHVRTQAALEAAIDANIHAVTEDPLMLCRARGIDAIVECTGEVEFGARVAMTAIEFGKHVILVNAELDATLGPILKVHADRRGVVITNTDGDEPGVAMNLYRMLKMMGLRPVLAGNLKGLIDQYRTPDTQREFAEKHDLNPNMATSFADGTKLAQEATILANATGFKVGKRGMFGHRTAHVTDLVNLFSPADLLRDGGWVDYLLGASPTNGAFVVAYSDDPAQQRYLSSCKMGDGPLYCFYTPYHLPQVQVISTIARAVLFEDATIAPAGPPSCDVIAIAKRDLRAGERLDGVGGFTCYGTIENATVSLRDDLLPIGLAEGCGLKRDVLKDQAVSYGDVDLPHGRLSNHLRAEQNSYFVESVPQ
jgi:predicted homoserine dehydrogenase-like protein